MAHTIAKQGMRIHAYSPDQGEDWGEGTVIRIEKLVDDETGEVFSANMPMIRLDNGKEILGIDCWWRPSEIGR